MQNFFNDLCKSQKIALLVVVVVVVTFLQVFRVTCFMKTSLFKEAASFEVKTRSGSRVIVARSSSDALSPTAMAKISIPVEKNKHQN